MRILSDGESRTVRASLDEFAFWTRRDFLDTYANDGELWIVEGRRGSGYHRSFLANADTKACRKLAAAFWRAVEIDPRLLN